MIKIKSVLSKDIIELIIFEFSPDAMRSFLSTEIANRFREDIRRLISPDYVQKHYLRISTLTGMGYLFLACLYFEFPTKKRKSQKYLNLISYYDFNRLYHILVNKFLEIKGNVSCKCQIEQENCQF